MPEMHFTVEWPSGHSSRCYSPSYVIEEHLQVGGEYPVDEFLSRVRRSLQIASDRVRARYGFACSSAEGELAQIEATAATLDPRQREGRVKITSFEKHPPRDARASR
jgi:uncharacterized repeat protein (TIGR04042 family)